MSAPEQTEQSVAETQIQQHKKAADEARETRERREELHCRASAGQNRGRKAGVLIGSKDP